MVRSIVAALPALAVAATVAGTAAHADTTATAVASVNLRAGPGTGYPVVTTLPRAAALTVFGCTEGVTWCDVAWGPNRGWVAAAYIALPYQGRVTVLTSGIAPAIGVSVVTFSQTYWNTYYVGRPWYGQWSAYYRPAPPRAAAVGCTDRGCGGVVARPGRVAGGYCTDDVCRGAVVRHGPNGVIVRHGSVTRP